MAKKMNPAMAYKLIEAETLFPGTLTNKDEILSIVMHNPGQALKYSLFIIKGRWPEAESIIASKAKAAYDYAFLVIKGRWLEAESVIATDSDCAYWYAYDVIKGRFVEAESVIATDRHYAERYNGLFGTNI